MNIKNYIKYKIVSIPTAMGSLELSEEIGRLIVGSSVIVNRKNQANQSQFGKIESIDQKLNSYSITIYYTHLTQMTISPNRKQYFPITFGTNLRGH